MRDRRGDGVAALAVDLLTSGQRVLVVVADVARRREALERLVASASPDGTLGVIAWDSLAAEPALAAGYPHLLVLDPPPVAEGIDLAAAAPGGGLVYLAWGDPERAFVLEHWRSQLDLRPALIELWRALDGGGLDGPALEQALRGRATYPRGGVLCGRLLRVLGEVGLAEYRPAGAGAPAGCRAVQGARTDLARSAANRAYAARLAAVERHLRPETHVRAAARAG